MNHVVDVHRPASGDVIDLILEDHRLFEELLRNLRDASSDRADLGEVFVTERNRQIDHDCGTLINVRALMARARREGKLE
jgi:hypothetical protein